MAVLNNMSELLGRHTREKDDFKISLKQMVCEVIYRTSVDLFWKQ
jgi:hypothetical protein